MNHDHEHHHGHCHGHGSENKKKLAIVLGLTLLYMFAEIIGGFLTNSLALLADAGHMLSDVGALALSFFALWLVQKPASAEKTYGYYRTEILAAFINGIALVIIALYILYEAYIRALTPYHINAAGMISVAVGGLIVNIIGVFLLHSSSKESLNIRGAFLHIVGDLLGSVGAIIAGIIIFVWGYYQADIIISIIISLLILFSAIRLVNEAANILLEATPSHINAEAVREAILSLPMIDDVHELHIWTISSRNYAMSVHVVSESHECRKILCSVKELIREQFHIGHLTIQIEPPEFHENEHLCRF